MPKFFTILFLILIDYQLHPLFSQDYISKKPSRDGIGKFYRGREISKIMGHFGAGWLERESRSIEENPKLASGQKMIGATPEPARLRPTALLANAARPIPFLL